MATIGPMTPTQLRAIEGYKSAQNWTGMYKYIADGIADNSIQVPGGTSSKTYFWFSQSVAINGNDGTSPAAAFIRGVAASGMQYGTNGHDGTAPAPGFISTVSNTIADRVATEILKGKGIPEFKIQLSNDISASFQMGISLGGWGGSFYHWNDIYIHPETKEEKTVGEWIRSTPGEYEKFINVNAKVVADLMQRAGDFTQDGSVDAFLTSLKQAGINTATDPLTTGFDAGIAYNQILGRAIVDLGARGLSSAILDALGSRLDSSPNIDFADLPQAGYSNEGRNQTAPVDSVPATAPFNPLPNSGTADNSFTIRPGDSLWKIGKTLGLSDSETARFVAETQANARAAGSDGNADDLRVGNTVAIPDWAKDRLMAYREASINGLDLPPPINPTSDGADGSDAHFNHYPAPEDSTPSTELKPDLTQEQSDALLANLGLKPTATSPAGVQYADAGKTTGNSDVVSDAGGGDAGGGSSVAANGSASNQPLTSADIAQTAPETVATPSPAPAPNPNNYAAYLSGAGASLSPAQQDALAVQLDALGLGGAEGAGALSFYPLPGGGVLIGNADGDIVGELGVAPDGELHLQSNAINAADGTTTTVDTHIAPNGQATSYSPYQLGQVNATLNLIQGLDGLQHWDKMDDLGHFSSLLGLSNSINTLSNGSLGNLGALNTFSSYVNLAQSIENGNVLGTLSSINGISSNQVIDGALNNALGSTGVPYLSIATALNDFEHHPGQSVGSLVGMYFGPMGSAIGGMIGGLLDGAGLFGSHDTPPPPQGEVHYTWDADGNMCAVVDKDVRGGGDTAHQMAEHVQTMLEELVAQHNAQGGEPLAINPYMMPKLSYSGNNEHPELVSGVLSIPTFGGGEIAVSLNAPDFAEQLLKALQDNGGIGPQWEVETQKLRFETALHNGQSLADVEAEMRLGIGGGQDIAFSQAHALQGNAAESADFKSQSFGTLVVHLDDNPHVHAAQARLNEVLRDVEGDGYLERTQSIAARDGAGSLQALLTIDFNGNGQIETRDILNLGGNTSANNPTDAAQLASELAGQQRNNMEWLDANGDGVIDKRDPAFAAIKLWVDLNEDGAQQSAEATTLDSLHIQSINFRTGEVTYEDGHTDALTAQTLKADTEGVRLTQITEVNPDGTLHVIDAGTVLEHEGYQGQVQVTDDAGTRWGVVREATFEQLAVRTGDWEGTAEQDAHRHGGGNVASAPTQTSATGAVSLGTVKRADEQGKALTDKRVVFVPAIATQGQDRADSPADQMVRSAQEGALVGGMGAGLGALAMVGLGAVQTTAYAAPDALPTGGLALDAEDVGTQGHLAGPDTQVVASPNGSMLRPVGMAAEEAMPGTWQDEPRRIVDAPPPPGVLADADALQRAGLDVSAYTNLREIRATLVSSGTPNVASRSSTGATDGDTPVAATATSTETLLALPTVAGEVLAGTEDTVLRIGTDLLLANDSTVNVGSNAASAPLHISAVGNPSHGQVSLQTSVNGAGQTVTEVVFLPDADFFGTASFSYTVTDPYGLSSVATATLLIENVNDAPYAQGEVVSGASEDAVFLINKDVLLANDGDVDDARSTLGIGWVGNAAHGTVSLDANGNVVFTPGLNFNGNAEFEYRTVDPAGLLSPTVQVVMPVAAVNDAPLTVDDRFATYRNSTMTIAFDQLTGNDRDVDQDALTVSAVRNAAHGAVSIVNGEVQFVPTADFRGVASFEYLSDDGLGGQSWATATVDVKLPPNLYPTVTVTAGGYSDVWYGRSAYYNPVAVWQNFSYQINDESPGSVQLQFVERIGNLVAGTFQANSFQFYRYDDWGADEVRIQFDIVLTDQEGIVNTTHVYASYDLGAIGHALISFSTSTDHTGLFISPVVLDLNGDGVRFNALGTSKVTFDMDGDGIGDRAAWASNDDGVLVWDRDHNGHISDAGEFSFQALKAGAKTDLEGLQALDTSGNGQLDAGDERFAEFGVWRDANGNGVTDAGEFRSLTDSGIASISLHSNGQMREAGSPLEGNLSGQTDVTVMGDGVYTRTDGSTGTASDAMFAYQRGIDAQVQTQVQAQQALPPADHQAAELNRQALLFNQFCNTASDIAPEPLGFIPIVPEGLSHEVAVNDPHLNALQAA